LVAALQVLAVLVADGGRASEVCRRFDPYPQQLTNVRFDGGAPLKDKQVKAAIRDGEARLSGSGRLLIRPSGTEPVIRVMAEGEDEALIASVVGEIAAAIEQAAQARP
ncbi:MAG: phosphoglucosamine mutase, partial [Rhodospirillaceae bacterium]